MIKELLVVGFGGGVGSILRYLTSRLTVRFISSEWVVVGTFIANIIGCFAIGFIVGSIMVNSQKDHYLSLMLITGFCGGYTTFSAFAFENLQMWQSGNTLLSLLYTLSSILLGIFAVWVGMKVA